MVTAEQPESGRVLPLVIGGSVVVAFTTPLNFVLFLVFADPLQRLCNRSAAILPSACAARRDLVGRQD